MTGGNPKPLTPELRAELEALEARSDSDIDLTDPECPEVKDWSRAVRGALFRPEKPLKQPVSVRLDADVLAWFKQSGEGYQTRINAALREYMSQHQGDRG